MLGAPDADYINANYIDVSAAPSVPRVHPIQVSLFLGRQGTNGTLDDWVLQSTLGGRRVGRLQSMPEGEGGVGKDKREDC